MRNEYAFYRALYLLVYLHILLFLYVGERRKH